MSSRGEETQHDEERPRPVRFSIFGQIQQQQQRASMSHHHVSIKGIIDFDKAVKRATASTFLLS